MPQDPNQTGPYDPHATNDPRYRPSRSRSADPAPGSEESTHIWADGIGLGGDAYGTTAESRPTGYASAGQSADRGSATPPSSSGAGTYNGPGTYSGSGANSGSRAHPDDPSQASPYSRTAPSYGEPTYGEPTYGQPAQNQYGRTAPSYGEPAQDPYSQTAPTYGGGPAFGQPEAYDQPYGRGAEGYVGGSQQPYPYPGDQAPTAETDAVAEAQPEGPIAALRDLTFAEPAAPKVARYLYLLLIIAGALYWIGAIVSGFTLAGAAGLTALIGGAVLLAAWVLLVRVGLEVALSVIRLGEDARAIRTKLEATPDDASATTDPAAGTDTATTPEG